MVWTSMSRTFVATLGPTARSDGAAVLGFVSLGVVR